MVNKILTLLLTLAFCVNASAQEDRFPKIRFYGGEYDFGQFDTLAGPQTHVFTFKNTGTAKLVITKVNAFCECLSVTYPKDFIAPGDTASVVVTYNSNQTGTFYKDVQVYTNCQTPMTRLFVKGEIVEGKIAPVVEKAKQTAKKKKKRKK